MSLPAEALPAYHAGHAGSEWADPLGRRPVVPGWRHRWERPLTWWSIIGLCSGFWYGVLHFAGAV